MVSIIVTTYNETNNYLLDCLASCLNQAVTKEIILVDDCSPKFPFSEELKAFIKNNGIKQHNTEKNVGLAGARNHGIGFAKYDLVIPIDGDDFFMKDAVAMLADHVDSKHHIFHGNVFDNNPKCNSWVTPPCKGDISKINFMKDNPLYCSSLFKKEVWENNGGYTVRPHSHYEDYNFWAKSCAKGYKFKYCNVNVYQHTYRQESMLMDLHDNSAKLKKLAIEGVF